VQQDPSGYWISTDGNWRWDGQAWVPNSAVTKSFAGTLTFGDVISIPTRDQRWLAKCGIEGLIALIPIYGTFEVAGWTLSYLDNLRSGPATLPEAGFGYARRGSRLALVALIYSLVAVVLFYLVFFGAIFLMAGTAPKQPPCPSSSCSSTATAFPAFLFAGLFVVQGIFLLVYAALHFIVLPVAYRTEREGVGAGLNLVDAVKMAAQDPKTAAAGAALIFIAYFISSLGIYACLIGVVFSYGYAAAMFGAALRWYEQRRALMTA